MSWCRHPLMPAVVALGLGLTSLAACGGDDDDGNPDASAICASPGGAVSGAVDTHCTEAQAVDPAICEQVVPDAGPDQPDAGDGGSDFGDTLYGAEGDDDDCKYHLTWTSTPVCQNTDVTFTVTAIQLADNAPVTDPQPYIEAFLDETHPAPNSSATAVPKGNGTYDIGPIRFDAPGRWTVRYHLFGTCPDSEESPHGHGAFFVDVP
jgi:hypothetical protein